MVNRQATGGRAALAGVESVRETGTVSMSVALVGDLEGSYESVTIPNQKAHLRIDSEPLHLSGGLERGDRQDQREWGGD